MSDLVYLLRMQGSTDFKIGFSVDVRSRIAGLPEEINLAESLYIECATLSARRVEKTLHTIFHQFRLATHRGDGHTEWFDGACFERVREFLASYGNQLGCSTPKPLLSVLRALPSAIRISREEARRRRREEWERARVHSVEISTAVLAGCLGALRAALLTGALKGRGHWTNKHGSRVEFLAFVPAPETEAWRDRVRSDDPRVRPWLSVCFEELHGEVVSHCHHNYILCPTCIAENDGSGWYAIDRPHAKLTKVTPLFEDLNSFLSSIPPLSAYALRRGRTVLRNAEAKLDRLMSGEIEEEADDDGGSKFSRVD